MSLVVVRRFVLDRWSGFRWWMLGSAAMIGMLAAIYPSIEGDTSFDKTIDSMPESIKSIIGFRTGLSLGSPTGYLQGRILALTLPVLIVIYAIGLGARAIAGDEETGILEFVLGNPVSRRAVAFGRLGAVALLVTALSAISLVFLMVMSAPVGLLDGVSIGKLAASCGAAACISLLHLAVSFAAGAKTGKRSTALAAGAGLAVGGYVIQGVASSVSSLDWLKVINPWAWYLDRITILDGPNVPSTLVPLVLAGLLAAYGVHAFSSRDLR